MIDLCGLMVYGVLCGYFTSCYVLFLHIDVRFDHTPFVFILLFLVFIHLMLILVYEVEILHV